MNRLTKRGKHGTAFAVVAGNTIQRVVFQRREYQDKVVFDKRDIGPILDALAAYEDLGLSPETLRDLLDL